MTSSILSMGDFALIDKMMADAARPIDHEATNRVMEARAAFAIVRAIGKRPANVTEQQRSQIRHALTLMAQVRCYTANPYLCAVSRGTYLRSELRALWKLVAAWETYPTMRNELCAALRRSAELLPDDRRQPADSESPKALMAAAN